MTFMGTQSTLQWPLIHSFTLKFIHQSVAVAKQGAASPIGRNVGICVLLKDNLEWNWVWTANLWVIWAAVAPRLNAHSGTATEPSLPMVITHARARTHNKNSPATTADGQKQRRVFSWAAAAASLEPHVCTVSYFWPNPARAHMQTVTPSKVCLENRKQSQEETHFSGVTSERLLMQKPQPSQHVCCFQKESHRKMFERDQSSSTFRSVSSKRFHCAFVWGRFKVPHHRKCIDLYRKIVFSLSRVIEKPVLHICSASVLLRSCNFMTEFC